MQTVSAIPLVMDIHSPPTVPIFQSQQWCEAVSFSTICVLPPCLHKVHPFCEIGGSTGHICLDGLVFKNAACEL